MNQSLIFQTIAKYSEPWRKFHTTQHLGYLWKTYEEACVENPAYLRYREMMEYLIPFHDWVYVPGYNKNEEDSADFAHWWLTKIEGFELDVPLSAFGSCFVEDWGVCLVENRNVRNYHSIIYRRVPDIIRGTKHHLNPQDILESLFFDMDLCGIGSSLDYYKRTAKQLEDEFVSMVGYKSFDKGRRAWINSMLERPKIFTLPEFAKFEEPARANLKWELEQAKQISRIFIPNSE